MIVPRAALSVVSLLVLVTGCRPAPPVARIEDLRLAQSADLVGALGHGSSEARARAALALGRIQSSAYAPALAGAAGDADRTVRLAALFALGQLGLAEGARPDPTAVAAALSATEDPDPEIAAAAFEALGKLADRSTASRVAAGVHHEASAVRVEVATALFRLRFVPLWRKEVDAPPELPPEGLAALLEALHDPVAEVRRAAAHACSRYGEPEAVLDLQALVGDADEWTRLFAVRALGRSKDPSAADELRRAARDPSVGVRFEAVEALAVLDRLEGLLPLARDGVAGVRAAMARALGAARDPESIEILWKLEGDPIPAVRVAAIPALARRLGAEYGERILEWFTDPDWRVRAAAARAAAFAGPQAESWLVTALDDGDSRVQVAALEGLGRMKQGRETILSALESPDLALRGTAVELIAELDPVAPLDRLTRAYDGSAGHEWVEIRESLVDVLARRDEASEFLRRVAGGDPAAAVRARARRALGERGIVVPVRDDARPAASPPVGRAPDEDPVVILETGKGEIRIRLFARDAPAHVQSFVSRVREGFYDGLIWHRVVPNFVIQGGDPRGDGWGGAGHPLPDEINRRRFERGSVGMPKSGKDTGDGQLFITHLPTPHLDGNYTVFGQVVSGLDVVDAIEVGDAIEHARER